ncbi:uncharacterized protein F4807DRAFT_97737 [Annulohypoxylon truncatum]|uniref:uncharacterized protein n=1 Tax=Annulohypoxylon truncatum TaxID=327061 RepID=UPI0020083443|nr:uncharacterized protein F4807DRAFT_97737 [Annulohypoxylon truncatum]KAI1209590.1 hypothetical protein F4807DRAFT_97737 [Annulohypoxylon truncatum]
MNSSKSKIATDEASPSPVSPASEGNPESQSAICDPAKPVLNMAELYRVTQSAFRSTSILRSSASRWPACPIPSIRQLSTTPILRPVELGNGRLPIAFTQYRNYSDDPYQVRTATKVDEVKKPDMSAYDDDDDDIYAPEIDFDTGELAKVPQEARSQLTRPPMRLIPRTGRTIRVGKSVDVARSFTLLNIQIGQNRVKQDARLQKAHERPGLKRKRLKSERWRKRFRKGFKSCVARVKELTKQGW